MSVAHALAIAITFYGGLLRLDAFVGKYGTLDHPTWARIATGDVAPLAARIRPSSVVWQRVPILTSAAIRSRTSSMDGQ